MRRLVLVVLLSVLAFSAPAHAFTLPAAGAGTDGALNPTSDVQIDLGLATTGAWDSTNGTGNGVYDPAQWLVIFRYTAVDIPVGVTVTFKNHPSGAPVAWLVQGNVNIAGTVNLDGADGQVGVGAATPATPGPGGFPGGRGQEGSASWSGGLGPGGGPYLANLNGPYGGCGGSFATRDERCGGPVYGNAACFPLIGGSGGAGSADGNGHWSGGAGGGAFLLATTQSISIDGRITADGGYSNWAGAGSGGAIRLVADTLAGVGALSAVGDTGPVLGPGGSGRLRVEANQVTFTNQGSPPYTAALPALEPKIFLTPGDGTPLITAVTLGGNAIPADTRPRRPFPADVEVNQAGTQTVEITAQYVPQTATINVRVIPRSGPDATFAATFVSTGPGPDESHWTAVVTMPEGFSSLQAYAVLAK